MSLENRKIEDYVESKLRQTKLHSAAPGFTQFVMKRITSEFKSSVAEEKRDRAAKYIIGIFSAMMVGFTVLMGYLAKSDLSSAVKSTGVSIEPTIETSNNFLQDAMLYIQVFFMKVLGIFGLSLSPQSVSIIIGLLLIIVFYFVADRVFLKGKLKSIRS